MRLILFSMSMLIVSAGSLNAATPNIVFILTDDLGFGDVTCNNPDSKIPTPNLDMLAGQGMRFTAAHAPTAVCTPTRYGVLTGRHCSRTRLKDGVLEGWDSTLIEHDRMTVASMLREGGYTTALVGKWHLGLDWGLINKNNPVVGPYTRGSLPARSSVNIDFKKPLRYGPREYGFDYSFITPAGAGGPTAVYIQNDSVVDPNVVWTAEGGGALEGYSSPGFKSVETMPTHMGKARAWLIRQASLPDSAKKPFYLQFTTTSPHAPIVPAPDFAGAAQAGKYGDFVYQTDWCIGQVMHLLDSLHLSDNTLLMVSSDNGPEVLTCELVAKYGHRSVADLRGMKRDTWEGGVRVPFFARWPGKIPAGAVSQETICLTDLMATAAAIIGYSLPPTAGEDSYSILPVLLGKPLSEPVRPATLLTSGHGGYALLSGKWAYIDGKGSNLGNDYPLDSFDGSPLVGCGYTSAYAIAKSAPAGQLYDLEADHQELNNLYTANPTIWKHLDSLLETYKTSGRSAPASRNEAFFEDLFTVNNAPHSPAFPASPIRIHLDGAFLQIHGLNRFTLSVFDFQGRLVGETKGMENSRMAFPTRKAGLYLIRVSSGASRFSRKAFLMD